jgi:primosomal protein N' (replication factor Y)
VDVCVAVPRLAVDRPFTYRLSESDGAGTGSLVSVSFHGRTVRGWVLGPAAEVPPGRLLGVRRVRSGVRFFDPSMLEVLRWMADRYLAPLATVIERSHPPRVASEEGEDAGEVPLRPRAAPPPGAGSLRAQGGGAARLLEPGSATWLRPLPDEEGTACVDAVEASLLDGRPAVVIVPEADPLPATARAVLERFGADACAFLAGDARERYRAWLGIRAGRYAVVVGTRPAVFAPLVDLGLIWVSREVHPGHREERAPYYHVRDVALARARLQGAACVLASLSPSVETVAACDEGSIRVARPARSLERSAAPLVETVAPEGEDRSARLGALLKRARSAALIVSRRGYGVARVCRACHQPAACARCRGPIVVEGGRSVCRVCGAVGVCTNCGATHFGVERGGTERIAEWASRVAASPTVGPGGDGSPPGPTVGAVTVGTAASVIDVGPLRLDLVAILDPDRALARAGLHAGERSLATWMEAAAWAGPRGGGGRVLVQTRRPGHPAIQALVRWEPDPYLRAEAHRRAEAGLPAGRPVFRVIGSADLPDRMRAAGADVVLVTSDELGTLCLVTVASRDLRQFGTVVRALASEGVAERVEAEPQL